MKIDSIRPDDVVRITGVGGDGRYYINVKGVVATVSQDGAIKIWPDGHIEIDNSKLWFEDHNIESITIIEKSELYDG